MEDAVTRVSQGIADSSGRDMMNPKRQKIFSSADISSKMELTSCRIEPCASLPSR